MDRWRYKTARDIDLGPAESAFSVNRETALASAGTQFLSWTAIWLYLRMYHRFKVIGKFPADLKPPFVIIGNHASHLDALILAAALPARLRHDVYIVAAGDVFFASTRRAMLSTLLLNCVPMWRKSAGPHAMRQLRERIAEGDTGFILFPEGARSRDGKMLRFKPGLGMLVAGTQATIIPCRIRGAFKACPPEKGMPRPYRIILKVGEPLRFDNAPNSRRGWEEVVSSCEAAIRGRRASPPAADGTPGAVEDRPGE